MITKKLSKIQKELKAPKNQYNSFGGYNYRSCEDIMMAVKPLLDGCVLTLTDEIVSIDGRFYVKATAKLEDGDEEISVSAYAREAETKTKMDVSQITGASSSYARKYALNGLFLIDDVKDADSTNTHGVEAKLNTLTDKQQKTFREWAVDHGANIEDIEKKFGNIGEMTYDTYQKVIAYIKGQK